MAEMLVALWLSCCKPHSPGRVKPTFKPKPRYRQPGQQQWHISTYPKTKCPSFVCNPHSSNLASQHMELSLGGLREIGVVLCSHLTAQYCLEELRWNFCKTGSCDQCWFFYFFSLIILLTFFFFFSNVLNLFFACVFFIAPFLIDVQTQITWRLNFKVSNNWTSRAQLLTNSLWIPFWPVGPSLEGK